MKNKIANKLSLKKVLEDELKAFYAKLEENKGNSILVEKKTIIVDNYGVPGVHYFMPPIHIFKRNELEIGLIDSVKKSSFSAFFGSLGTEVIAKDKFEADIYSQSGWIKKEDNKIFVPDIFISGMLEYMKEHRPCNEHGLCSGTYIEDIALKLGKKEIVSYFNGKKINNKYFITLEKDIYEKLK